MTQASTAVRVPVETVDPETGEVIEGRPSPGTALTVYEGGKLARREMVGGLIRPVAQPDEVLRAQEETRELIVRILKAGRDYDTIPGTSKPTMLQPGAERSAAAFGLYAEFDILEQEVDHDRTNSYVKRTWEWHAEIRGKKVWSEEPGQSEGLYRYVVRCRLIHRASGIEVGTGVGSCSTMESKYIDRPRDLENTVLKMAKKRAYVDAVLTTLGLHDQFTQDIEDNPEAFGAGKPRPANGGTNGQRASAKQVNFLKSLLKRRQVDPDAEAAVRQEIEAGLTSARASAMIERLKALPEKSDGADDGPTESEPQPEPAAGSASARIRPALELDDDDLPF